MTTTNRHINFKNTWGGQISMEGRLCLFDYDGI